MNDDPHLLLGGYILGGLDDTERRQFEAHLSACPQCRRDVADCAPVPGLLAKMDPADLADDPWDVLPQEPPRRSHRRWLPAAVLASAAALIIGVATVTMTRPDEPSTTRTYAVQEISGDVAGRVTLTPTPWGTAISLDLDKVPREGVFTLRTMDEQGRMQPAANWSGMPSGKGVVLGSTSIPMPDLRTLNVVDINNTVLATVQRN